MKGSLKSFLNRCRCCLSQFATDEQTTPITDFFEIQFFAFTHVELKKSEHLSSYICEYCHSELLRFSVFKKELIEKQQQLYALLTQYIQRRRRKNTGANTKQQVFDVDDDDEEEEEEEEDGDDEGSAFWAKKYRGNERIALEEDELYPSSENDQDESMEEEEDEDLIEEIKPKLPHERNLTPLNVESENELSSAYSEEEEEEEELESDGYPGVVKRAAARRKPSVKKTIGELICDYCSKIFITKQGLVAHVKSHINSRRKISLASRFSKTHSSSKLKLSRKSLQSLNENHLVLSDIKSETKRVKKYPSRILCYCGCKCYHARSLYNHILKLHGSIYKCPVECGSEHKTLDDWMGHIRENHPESEKICCNIAIALKQVLKGEGAVKKKKDEEEGVEEKHELPKERPVVVEKPQQQQPLSRQYPCGRCSKIFNHASSLKVHINSVHSKSKRYKCSVCGKPMKQLSHLRAHLKKIHNADNRPYTCWCDEKFATMNEMKAHEWDLHEDARTIAKPFVTPLRPGGRFECYCKKTFFTNKLLTKHFKRCEIFKMNEKEDEKGETKEQEYKCNICNYVLASLSNLYRHQRLKKHYTPEQSKAMRATCGKCRKKFRSDVTLKRHFKFSPKCAPK